MPIATDCSALREVFRKYTRSASRLRDGMDQLGQAGELRFALSVDQNTGTVATFNESDPQVRFAALLRPFMHEGSPIEIKSVWAQLSGHDHELTDVHTGEVMAQNFAAAEDLGGMALRFNERDLTARDVYFAYAEGEFFDQNPKAVELLRDLSFGPMKQMLPFLFYTACSNYARLALAVLEVILAIEKKNPQFAIPRGEPHCIICLNRFGDFRSEEHVIPEAFGLDELVLRDGLCLACNNEVSVLDQYLAEFELLAFLRVQNVPLTKKGKFPRADLRDFILEKRKPRVIRITSKTGGDVLSEEILPDGSIHFSTTVKSKRPVDIVRLARAVFKIALGVVAIDAGVEVACDARFNAARAFIRGQAGMPNHMLMNRNIDPSAEIATQWHPAFPTVVMIDIFGVRFAVNLEPLPLGIPNEVPLDTLYAFWLGELTSDGVVPPCVTSCNHRD